MRVVGPWLFLIIRLLSWAWPLVFRALWPYAIFRVLTVITVVGGVLSIVAQLVPFGYLMLAVWPILAVPFGLEVLYRLVFRRVTFSRLDRPAPTAAAGRTALRPAAVSPGPRLTCRWVWAPQSSRHANASTGLDPAHAVAGA